LSWCSPHLSLSSLTDFKSLTHLKTLGKWKMYKYKTTNKWVLAPGVHLCHLRIHQRSAPCPRLIPAHLHSQTLVTTHRRSWSSSVLSLHILCSFCQESISYLLCLATSNITTSTRSSLTVSGLPVSICSCRIPWIIYCHISFNKIFICQILTY
jgi:hypothetical protein